MNGPLVFNIQRFSIHDGPGIRTTAFFKGCPLRCLWCHNPESQGFAPEVIHFEHRCTNCGRCRAVCGAQGGCTACGHCVEACCFLARQMVGEAHEPEALARLLLRDQAFYDNSGGGVTLSGGEPMAQDAAYRMALLRALKRRGAHVCVDSCGFAPWRAFEEALPLVDLFMMDFKALNGPLHRALTGVDNAQILENLRALSAAGAKIWLRVPVVPQGNLSDMADMAAWAARFVRAEQVNLLAYHRMGQEKGARLNAPPAMREFPVPDEGDMETVRAIWSRSGAAPVVIGG